ncbi:DNA-binding XRE family transcriptional regulator [Clostridium beijerinckii]|nr:DNA-binding XRE family transcriptional regulator [Clostridium beijerinckii]
MKNLKMKSARASMDLSQEQLADIVGRNKANNRNDRSWKI